MTDNEKFQQFGAELRLTEGQAKVLAERMPQAGVVQVLDDEPLCMAKRIEELEVQVRVMAGLLREAGDQLKFDGYHDLVWCIDAALSGNLPAPAAPEGWQLVPVEPTLEMITSGLMANTYESDSASCILARAYRAMIAAAPKPEVK